MRERDAQEVLDLLARSAAESDEPEEEPLEGSPHLEWVLITAVDDLPCTEGESTARAFTPPWSASSLLSSTGLSKVRWPLPGEVAAVEREHWVSVATREADVALITSWGFQRSDGSPHMINGVPVSARHLGESGDKVEEFAQSVAGKVGWSCEKLSLGAGL